MPSLESGIDRPLRFSPQMRYTQRSHSASQFGHITPTLVCAIAPYSGMKPLSERQKDAKIPYTGRFAPSPTGPLHFGSLVTALASWLDARAHAGRWLLRIEDVDTPRTVAGAAEHILADLERFGLHWDEAPVWQSQRTAHYEAALARLTARGCVYGCACTRREMADSSLTANGARRYPGTCRAGLAAGRVARAWRLKTEPGTLCFDDRVQGRVCEDVAAEVGDFILRRADGVFAYQLAVVVDDADANITHIVRGADLLDSTPRQIFLQQRLGYPTPTYLHVPVAAHDTGEKLSKQTLAQAISALPPSRTLAHALDFLGHPLPAALRNAPPPTLLAWATAHWNPAAIAPQRSARAPDCTYD